jgi:hypothetical protein
MSPMTTTKNAATDQSSSASSRLTSATRVKTSRFRLRLSWDRAHANDEEHQRRYRSSRAELLRVGAVAEELSLGQSWIVSIDTGIAEQSRDGLHLATAGLSIEFAGADPAEQAAAFLLLETLASMC